MTQGQREPATAVRADFAPERPKAKYIQFTAQSTSDSDNPTYYVSPEIEMVIGYPADKMIDDKDGSWWNSLLHPDDLDRYWAIATPSNESGEPFSLEYRVKHASGEWIWIREDAQLVNEGNREFWMGTLQDITDLRA